MDDYDDYDDYDSYSEELSGLTIHENLTSVNGEMDEADKWLAEMGEDDLGGESKSYQSELYGAATPATLQLGRIGHVEPRIQAGIKALLSGQNIEGIHPVDAAAAREEFASIIGGDTVAFAKQIKFDEAVQLPRDSRDLKTVVSMLGNTAGDYLDRGPGGSLANYTQDAKKQAEADDSLAEAIGYVKELANLYIDPRTIGSSVEGARRRAVEEALTKRFIDGTFYDGSKEVLPLPNETGVTGLVRTQGIYGSPQGTAEDRLSSGRFDEKYKTTNVGGRTRFVRDDRGYKVFRDEVTQAERNQILRSTPSIQNSLFSAPKLSGQKTYSIAELDKIKRDRDYQYSQAQYKATKARSILRQQMPTTRDEGKNQIRMSGWDAPYDEQADLQNLRNEAAILGLEWSDIYAGQGEASRNARERSTLTDFVESESEKETITSGEIKQGTTAWLAQRKGKITASTAANLLREGGVEERALELAMERLGTATPFVGNADTREGNEGEARAAAAFMAGAGRNLTMEEAYFEENKKYKGFGVSPDGRLYDSKGESAGLLELKYLSSGSMKGALTKYTPQMQMQMAITGESQTHFYALDKFTGEYVHEVVKADPSMQEQLIEAGQSALSMAAGLDNRGVQALRNKIESSKPRQRKGASSDVTGQTTAFVAEEETIEKVMPFNDRASAVDNLISSGSDASQTLLARKLEMLDQNARMKSAINNAKDNALDVQTMGKLEAQAYEEDKKRSSDKQKAFQTSGKLEVSAYAEDAKRTREAQANEEKDTADKKKKADNEAAEASKKASESVRNFGESVRKAASILSELGGLITGGNASGMSEVRLAAESGQDVAEVRGTREALELGGLDTAGATRTFVSASNLVKTFNDEQQAAGRFTKLMEDRGRSNLTAVNNLNIPSIQDMQSLTPSGMTSMVANLMQGKSPQARAQIGEMFGMSELSTYNKDPNLIMGVDSSINEQNLRETYGGIQTVEQIKREALEQVGEVGGTGGAIGSGLQTVGAVAGSATAGYAASKAAPFMQRAVQASPKAATAIKNLSTIAKATPVALAASIAPMVARSVLDIKDNNSTGDKVMDVAEFASYGAGIGGTIGAFAGGIGAVPGAAIGAGIGGLIGLGNEAWEYFSADDAMPNANIGYMPTQTSSKQDSSKQSINVTVSNEISRDLIRTTTDVDGDLNIDEETGLGTGG